MSELNQSQTSSDPEAQAGFEVPLIEQKENIIFSEERPVQTHEVFAAQSTYKDDLAHQLSMPEKPWHTSQLIQRPIRVGTYSWSTTGALWTTNNKLDIPRSFYGLNYFLVNVLSMFAFLRADFVIRIQLNSTNFIVENFWLSLYQWGVVLLMSLKLLLIEECLFPMLWFYHMLGWMLRSLQWQKLGFLFGI